MNYPNLAEDAREVLRTLTAHEQQVSAERDRWFLIRIMPYRTAENMIDGLVMTFADITTSKRLKAKLRGTQARLESHITDLEGKLEDAGEQPRRRLGRGLAAREGKISHDRNRRPRMPGSYLIDVARGIVFTRAWGVLVDAEVLAHGSALKNDPRFHHGLRQIADFRELTSVRVTTEGVTLAAQRNPFRRDARRALVAPSDESFGVSRMFEHYMDADPEQFRVFRDLGPALLWVGLDPAMAWPDQPPDVVFGAAEAQGS